MDKWKIKAAELMVALALTEKKYPAVIPYRPQKTFLPGYEKKHFKRTVPERCGVANSRIYRILDELEKSEKANIHSIMILSGSSVIAECSRPGYDVNLPHQAHSMSKSLTAIAVLMLFEEGILTPESRLCDIFPEYEAKDKRFRNITVEHLLTMSTGISFNEAGAVSDTEWTRAIFNSKLDFAPGSRFAYNSMNSYILSRIVTRISGLSLTEYLTEHLFAPLGIKNGFWEVSPEGIEKGGWGAYLSAESFAKIGLMMSSYGVFEGERILSEEWVKKAIASHIKTSEHAGDFDYGYQIWTKEDSSEFLFNGMLGQNLWMFPGANIVVSMTAENNEMFQKSEALNIVRKYLAVGNLSEEVGERINQRVLAKKERYFLSESGYAKLNLGHKRRGFRLPFAERHAPTDSWDSLVGTYTLADNNQSVIPLVVRIVQNNYTGGIESLTVEKIGKEIYLSTHEGGSDYKIPIGINAIKSTVLDVNGEKYIVSGIGERRVEGTTVKYRIELLFPELANSRQIELSEGRDGRLIIKMTESPDQRIGEAVIEALYVTNPKLSFAIRLLESKLGDKIIMRKLKSMFAPTLVGVNKSADKRYEIMNSENEKHTSELKITKPASAIILKALNEAPDTDEKETPSETAEK